jgi:hypothetical protein
VIFGRLSFGFLAISVLSGIALVPFHDLANPLAGVERLQGGIPWGSWLRGLHGYSSFGVLIGTVLHTVESLRRRAERSLSPGVWWRSVALLPMTVLALLGGFVMRGDAEATLAGQVWAQILDSIPLVSSVLKAAVLGAGPGFQTPGLHHAATATVLLWIFTAEHGHSLFPDERALTLAGLLSAGCAGLFPLPLGASAAHGQLLLGPWYLLGLQGMLVDLPVIFGWAGPLVLVLLLGAVRHVEGKSRSAIVWTLCILSALYVAFTVRLLLLHRSG